MNPFTPSSPEGVRQRLDTLKRRCIGLQSYTNYFRQSLESVTGLHCLETDKNLWVLHDEWDFARLYLHSYDPVEALDSAAQIEWPPLVVTDWIFRNGGAGRMPPLEQLGFHLHATYDRIICNPIRKETGSPPSEHGVRAANNNDAGAIHRALFHAFDKYSDHIPARGELERLIAARQVLLRLSAHGSVDGLVIFPIQGSSCNFNFLYSASGSAGLVRLLSRFYAELSRREVVSGFSWVRRTRPQVLQLHQSFGWRRDGTEDRIFMRG